MSGIELVRSFIARILDENGIPIGIGALVAPNRILTCAHVVEGAIRSDRPLSSTSNAVYCDLPLANQPAKAAFRTRPTMIRPAASSEQLGDVAILEVQENISGMATPARLAQYSDLWGAKYLVFGCPRGQEDGVWATGIVRAEQASGLVLLESDSLAGYDLGPGFSGGPVWHPESGTIIGIVKGAETDPRPRTGFMIPARAVVQAWPAIARVALSSSEFTRSSTTNAHARPSNIKIFIHAGEDMEDERGIATRVIERLESDPFIQDIARIQVFTWESSSTGQSAVTQMYTPEAAVLRGLPRPSECDLMICMIWNRLGPQVEKSGTSVSYPLMTWLLEDAHSKIKDKDTEPDIYLYSRKKPLLLDPDAADFAQRLEEHRQATVLVAGAKQNQRYAIREFESASSFEADLEKTLRQHMRRLIGSSSAPGEKEKILVRPSPGYGIFLAPYPGLRAFQTDDEAIFFGRGKETDHLLEILQNGENCFTIVGPSGVGKTSLVHAGILARLRRNSVIGSKDWVTLKMRPADIGDDAIIPLAIGLSDLLSETRVRDIADRLRSDPAVLIDFIERILESRPSWAKMVIFVDQMEELYSLCTPESAENFLLALMSGVLRSDVLVVNTLRSDYIARYLEQPLVSGVRDNILAVGAPSKDALFEMITRPAAWAGVEFEDGLADVIQRDVGQSVGALPLMAYALETLFRRNADNGVVTYASYEAVGGVKGAIGTRASKVTAALSESERETLPWIFSQLTELDRKGTASKKKALLSKLDSHVGAKSVVEAFAQARLLTIDAPSSGDREATFELGHEALLEHWKELSLWLDKRWIQQLHDQSATARESEMARRRKLACPRVSSGSAFPLGVQPDDGRYCWTVVDKQLFDRVLASVRWHPGRAPGLQSNRIQISTSDELPIIFRLRGMTQSEFKQLVHNKNPMIAEYWPNSAREGFRGITFVHGDRGRWRQDLVPSADAPVFILRLRGEQLWLDRAD